MKSIEQLLLTIFKDIETAEEWYSRDCYICYDMIDVLDGVYNNPKYEKIDGDIN